MQINDKTDLLDPLSEDNLSDYEKQVVEDARDAGKNLASTDSDIGDENLLARHNTGGMVEQIINSKAVAPMGAPGGESDTTGGIASRDETAGKIADENEYNE